jgi:hypothetical protein
MVDTPLRHNTDSAVEDRGRWEPEQVDQPLHKAIHHLEASQCLLWIIRTPGTLPFPARVYVPSLHTGGEQNACQSQEREPQNLAQAASRRSNEPVRYHGWNGR